MKRKKKYVFGSRLVAVYLHIIYMQPIPRWTYGAAPDVAVRTFM